MTGPGESGKTETASKRMRLGVALALLALLLAAVLAAGGNAASPTALERAVMAQEKRSDALLAREAIVGTAIGQDESGDPEIIVLAKHPAQVASEIDGVPVDVEVTGPIGPVDLAAPRKHPVGGTPTATPGPTGFFPRPVPIGVSTGNAGECSAGTIGARVRSGSNVYALSNNHVYALENKAALSSEVLQPGLYDTGCAYKAANHLGALADFAPIEFTTKASNVVDAAIASTSEASLGKKTPANGYGEPSSQTQAASVGLAVQKYGRTSSLTTGKVIAVNGIVDVAYSAGTARFVQQVFVEGKKPFLKAGDSGSLLVTQNTSAKPVGLLFAADSSGKFAFANPISAVLTEFGITIDGK